MIFFLFLLFSFQEFVFDLICIDIKLCNFSANEQICDPHSLPKCGEHERCLQTKVTEPATCQCERGYERNNNGVCTLLPTEVTTTVRPVIDHPKSGGIQIKTTIIKIKQKKTNF